MELKLSSGQGVFLDTAPLIYLFEEHERFFPPVRRILDDAYAVGAQLVSSMVTYIEVLTVPTRGGDTKLASRYRQFLTNSESLSIYPLNISVANEAVRLRAQHKLRTPDAIQVATAVVCGVDYFLTNNRDLARVRDVDVVVIADLVP